MLQSKSVWNIFNQQTQRQHKPYNSDANSVCHGWSKNPPKPKRNTKKLLAHPSTDAEPQACGRALACSSCTPSDLSYQKQGPKEVFKPWFP